MKKLLTALVLVLAAAHQSSAFKPEDGFGVGFVLGTPSGLSLSLPLGSANAVNAVLGYNLGDAANLQVQGDYVWIRENVLPVESGRISVYYGPGAFAIVGRDASAAGIRAVVGIDYRFADVPVQTFLEVGPGINVIPDTEAELGAGLGVRYYF